MHQQTQVKAPPEQEWANYTNMPVGDILRRAREYYGLRIEDAEGALRIRSSQLLALEEGHVEKLPGRVYAIGFIRAYSEFLGLDGDKMVHLFKAQLIGNKPRPELNFPVPASESKLPNLLILLGSFAGLALVAAVFIMLSSSAPHRGIPEVPAAIKQETAAVYGPPKPANLSEFLAATAPAAGTAEPENRVIIDAVDNAWVEIRNVDGKAILSRILKTGDSYLVPNEPGLVMDTGNVGALEFTVDGEKIAQLGEPGDVRRGVSLEPAELVPASGPDISLDTVE